MVEVVLVVSSSVGKDVVVEVVIGSGVGVVVVVGDEVVEVVVFVSVDSFVPLVAFVLVIISKSVVAFE